MSGSGKFGIVVAALVGLFFIWITVRWIPTSSSHTSCPLSLVPMRRSPTSWSQMAAPVKHAVTMTYTGQDQVCINQ